MEKINDKRVINLTQQYSIADDTVLAYVNLLKQSKIHLTDLTNAKRLAREFGSDIRWNYLCKKWLVRNGKFWKSDDSRALIHQLGIKTIHTFYDYILVTDDYQRRIELQKHAEKSESFTRQKCMTGFAGKMPEILIESDALDADPWLFNARNGTINLQTKELQEHKKENLITKIAPVEYDATADCPIWKKFIREIMNYNADLIQFLQTVAGYTISGDTSEQKMFILFGSGANGKSTFLNTIAYILGDYSMTAQTETFMKQQGDKMSNDLARLRGARFVTAAEADQGRRLSETLIKQITGNDRMTARFLFAEFFDFKPKFKLFLATNHKPVIKGTDNGIWRRIRLIPFTTTISEENQDKHLEEKLRGEASGILNWLLEGFERWSEKGLVAPLSVTSATDEYRAEMDIIGNFIKERCARNPGVSIKARELFKNYQDWCDDNNEHSCSERFFSLRLKELHIEQKRSNDGRYWQDITLNK